jgi:RHS repeat-associated protein
MRNTPSRRARMVWAMALAAVLPVPFAPAAAGAPVAVARPGAPSPLPAVKAATGVPVATVPVRPSRVDAAVAPARPYSWPAAGKAVVTGSGAARAGGLPVTVAAPAGRQVTVETLDRAATARAGVTGVLLSVSAPTAGEVTLSVDPAAFAAAGGADWASRLRVLRMPDGADVTTGSAKGRLTARVRAGAAPVTYALTAGAAGKDGDYRATSLSPSASWQVSAQTGDFAWSYPISGPPVPGGLAPQLSIDYSSGSIDGRTASSNNQASWVGDGFELAGGYVERGYRPCSEDGVAGSGNLCWVADNATLVLNGRSTPLVRDDTSGTWRPAQDDGSTIERLLGSNNGDDDGEHWKLTTIDGTQYFFGLNELPGWTSANPRTNSVWKVPVFGNGVGEPCHAAGSCSQAWRWNLDYVVDPHADAMAYYYAHENNKYGTGSATYQRGGQLARIEYGLRNSAPYAAAPAQIAFTTAERCRTTGTTCTATAANASNYPDSPLDQLCTGTCTASQKSPTFFSTKRLSIIEARAGAAPVDRWTLGQTWPLPGDLSSEALFLKTITHTGVRGSESAAVPAVTFDGAPMDNRVDGLEGWQALRKWRVTSVRSETGGQLEVNYEAPECVRSALPPAPDTNGKRCFAAWWAPPGEASQLDWFHKYVVRQTLDRDLVGGGRYIQTDYAYPAAGGAWHYPDSDEVTAASKRTWSAWRGYAQVTVTTGTGDDGPKTKVEQRFHRGMHGDKLTTGTRTATVTDSLGGSYTDADGLAGFPLESRTFNGATEVAGTVSQPYRLVTATHAHSGRTSSAHVVRAAVERGRTALATDTRETRTESQWDGRGQLKQRNDLGDTDLDTDDRCTKITYAVNDTKKMYSYPSSSTTVAKACGVTPTYPADAVNDTRTYYDGSTTLGAVPGAGDATRTDAAKSYTGSTATYLTTAVAAFDAYGRQTSTTDAKNRTSLTSYAQTAGLTTQTVSTDPLGYATTTTIDPNRGLPTLSQDVNSRRTELVYDPLGRITSVWLPGRARSSFPTTPDQSWTYSLSTTAAAAVTSKSMGPNGRYITSYALYDGLLRPRQTQSTAHDGSGRVVTDTTYDTRGLAFRSTAPYVVAGTAGSTLVQVDDTDIPGQTTTEFDAAGRPTASVFREAGTERWRTTTAYRGDHVDVTPPAGGTATSTWTDARGRTTKLQQYQAATPTGAVDATITYEWTGSDQPKAMTDTAGNRWTWSYDVLGRQTGSTDPDRGATTLGYDDAGQLVSATDARGTTLAYTYDELGRRTGEHLGTNTGPKLAEWVYDGLAGGDGLPTRSVRYDGTEAYTTAIRGYDSGGRSTGVDVTIPASRTGLAGTYSYQTIYAPDQQLKSLVLPATAGLPNETLTWQFNDLGGQATLENGLASYATDPIYSPFGELSRVALRHGGGSTTWLSSARDLATGRLSGTKVESGTGPTVVSDAGYTYDPAGNVTRIADGADTQCFAYDQARRLTKAWTPTSANCATAPTVAGLGGPAPYWQDYTWNNVNNRTGMVSHAAAGNTTTTYGYPAAGAAQPHTVRTAAVSGPGVTRTDSFAYDATGNTTTRTVAGQTRTFGWDTGGRLATVTGAATGTMFYDADGERLIRKDAAGSTLYLPYGVEVRVDANGANATSTRYYSFAGDDVAVRTAAGVSFLAADPHGTASIAIDAATGAVARRRSDPFGVPRGTLPAWPGERDFVGGTTDAVTGLTHLGAREYDPGLGRFISADPLLDPADPQQIDGYTYANGNPTTNSDPDGLHCNNGFDGDYCYTADSGNVPLGGGGGGGAAAGSLLPDPRGNPAANPGADYTVSSCGWSCRTKAGLLGTGTGRGAVRAGRITGRFFQEGGFRSPSFSAGVVDGVANAGYAPVRAVACKNLGPDCGLPTTVHIPLDGDTTSIIYKVGDLVGAVTALAIPFSGIAKIAITADRAATAAVTTARTSRATATARAAATPARSCNSFTADTPVLMADGTRKPIKDVGIGDEVLATDPDTGETAARQVTALIRTTGPHTMAALTLADGTTLHATDGHPIYNPGTRRFTKAIDYRPGDTVQTADGSATFITTTRTYPADLTAYNLQIHDIHTYYAGTTSTLVHNSCEMLGKNGTQTFSTTLTSGKHAYRVDVENPAPGVRPGQLHLQTRTGKYYYNFETNQFDGIPTSLARKIARDPDVSRAIGKGKTYLGVE